MARRVLGVQGDLAASMFALADSFGLSTVGCNYYSARQGEIQALFESATQDTFPEPPSSADPNRRVGSRLCVRTESVALLAASLRAGLIHLDPGVQRRTGDLADAHNRFVIYAMHVFAAATGRHAHGALAVTRKHLSLSLGAAVINDKETHRGHRGRLCALGSKCTEQIARLLAHRSYTLASCGSTGTSLPE